MNLPNLKKNVNVLLKSCLKSKTVQLVTFMVKGYIMLHVNSRTTTFENSLNINARPPPDLTTFSQSFLIDMLHKSRPQEFLSERSVLFRPRSDRASYVFASNKV